MRAPRTTLLFLVGVIVSWVTRGGLFLLSFGAIAPGLGWAVYGSLAAPLAEGIEFLVTIGLFVAALRGLDRNAGPRYAYRMGLVFLVDTIVYCAQIPLVYRGQGAAAWWPIGLICTQIPLAVISLLLISSAWTMRRPQTAQ